MAGCTRDQCKQKPAQREEQVNATVTFQEPNKKSTISVCRVAVSDDGVKNQNEDGCQEPEFIYSGDIMKVLASHKPVYIPAYRPKPKKNQILGGIVSEVNRRKCI